MNTKTNDLNKNFPQVRKGRAFPFQITVACWVDLLGYGSMIADAEYNPLREEAKAAVERIARFHQAIASHTCRHFRTLVLNDGAVARRDLSLRSRSVTHDFVVRCFRLFEDIRSLESRTGHPGARMILAAGFRIRRTPLAIESDHEKSILSRYNAKKITAEQAIREASRSRASVESIPDLQANFAFTKAYVADSGGKKAGLPGPGFYLDAALLSSLPPWLGVGEPVNWCNEDLRLHASFIPVHSLIDWEHPRGGPTEVRGGLEVAQVLSADDDVLSALRAAGKLGAERSPLKPRN